MKMKALSIRQPWASLIVDGHKDVENRDWWTSFRGPILIHAAKKCTRTSYAEAAAFALERGVVVPPLEQLTLGGIIGKAKLVDCRPSTKARSLWHVDGKVGLYLDEMEKLPFFPMPGKLGLFNVEVPDSW